MHLIRWGVFCDGLLSGDEGDESFPVRLLLNLPLQPPGVQHEAVDLDHPGHRALLDALTPHPAEVELAYLSPGRTGHPSLRRQPFTFSSLSVLPSRSLPVISALCGCSVKENAAWARQPSGPAEETTGTGRHFGPR